MSSASFVPPSVHAHDGAISRVQWVNAPAGEVTQALRAAPDQLREGFDGKRDVVDLPNQPGFGWAEPYWLRRSRSLPDGCAQGGMPGRLSTE